MRSIGFEYDWDLGLGNRAVGVRRFDAVSTSVAVSLSLVAGESSFRRGLGYSPFF